MIIWLIGMSASGKTTIGKKLYEKLLMSKDTWFYLDGDAFRNILCEDLGHSIEDRRKNAYRISRFCEYLSSQGVNVVACVLSIFHDNQQYNKDNIPNYKEVYIEVAFRELINRDNKQLYQQALDGKIKDVVGVDIEFKPPFSPDLVLDNNSPNSNFEEMVDRIISKFNLKLDDSYTYTNNNLLLNPLKYQYTKYDGKQFFERYITDRLNFLETIKVRIEKLNANKIEFTKVSYQNFIEKNDLILQDYLFYLLGNNDRTLIENKGRVSLLLKRFEVSKKLYTAYDIKEIKKSSDNYLIILNYPLFSLVLQKYHQITDSKEEKLICLNAILKVNDILSSIKDDIFVPSELFYCEQAVRGELKITKEYL